jgi:hypothetical protein
MKKILDTTDRTYRTLHKVADKYYFVFTSLLHLLLLLQEPVDKLVKCG